MVGSVERMERLTCALSLMRSASLAKINANCTFLHVLGHNLALINHTPSIPTTHTTGPRQFHPGPCRGPQEEAAPTTITLPAAAATAAATAIVINNQHYPHHCPRLRVLRRLFRPPPSTHLRLALQQPLLLPLPPSPTPSLPRSFCHRPDPC